MKSTLTLRKAIWNKDVRVSVMNRILREQAQILEGKLKDNIDNSTPAGRLYSRGGVTARRTKANSNLKAKRGTKTRVIVAANVFRSSTEGQPPARRFNTLYNSLIAKRVPGKLAIMASANAPGAAILDDPKRLDRPFFKSVITTFRREEFLDGVRSGVRELITT